ncbi:hypothetical protein [Tsukamurella sp. 1534]|uniref:hypothetical protein n=1 Tax=Tsukamurella sp. 1534 TaxID=1151061 RepID=UPI0002D5807A|nr:hypothetical protein [Tsukamurella sp. 1534]
MHQRFRRVAVTAAAVAGLALTAVPGTATAAGPVQLNGWVTKFGLADPFPNPSATYKGFVGAAGDLTVEADCVKNALIPSMPCQPNAGGPATTMRWHNVTTGARGTASFELGRARANPGKGTVNIRVTGGFGVVGMSSGGYTA